MRSSESTVHGCSRSATSTSTGSRPGHRIPSACAPSERKLDQMSPSSSGPRRSESVESYLHQTRVGAALALLALAAAIASEQFAEHLWVHHPLLAGLASSVIVVMLSVAVVTEALEIRGRRRWTVLAQYVM